MIFQRFRSRPSEIEAIQWTGDNFAELDDFDATVRRNGFGDVELLAGLDGAHGWVLVPRGHWIVRPPGDPSHCWPVDPRHFNTKYEPCTIDQVDEE